MDLNNFFDQVLQSGKEMARKGQNLAEDKLNIPAEGEQRDAMLSGLGKGAAAAGVLALLLGTKTGRKVTGTGLKIGSMAALGGIAWQMYNRWQQNQGDTAENRGTDTALPPPAEQTPRLDSETLLKAMVAAAKADGHVSEAELDFIRSKLADGDLGDNVNNLLLNELIKPLSATDIAALAGDDKAAAIELYLVSSLLINEANVAEEEYLNELQQALGLPDEAVAL
ncbi:MAG: tellurite resistance TerB family protein [Thiolinea sp.]